MTEETLATRLRSLAPVVLVVSNLNWGRAVHSQHRRLHAIRRLLRIWGIERFAVFTMEDLTGKRRERIRTIGLRKVRRGSKLASPSRLGFRIRLRRIVWVEVQVPGIGLVTLFVIHMPPRRYGPLYMVYKIRLQRALRRAGDLWAVGMDANKRFALDPLELERIFGAKDHSKRIDGFEVSPALEPYVSDVWVSKPHADEHVTVFLTLDPSKES